MSVSPEDTARHLRERERSRKLRGQERAARLTSQLPAARGVLGRFGARRVLLFGSLATGTSTETSDVDLAVEGLRSESYFDALAELMAVFHGPVDLVRIEEATDSLRERILAEGREL